MHLNFEFKAKTIDLPGAEYRLLALNPRFAGTDHQIDTYFNVPKGRLKLREGSIENALIHYQRSDIQGAKQSNVWLYQHQPDPALKQILIQALGVKVVVDKKRKIYFLDNVKFHFDHVQELGTFIEVEAIDAEGTIGLEKLQEQCHLYASLLEVKETDYIAESYSDLLLIKAT
jgi:predicted adenylyl cyclase CyaB